MTDKNGRPIFSSADVEVWVNENVQKDAFPNAQPTTNGGVSNAPPLKF